MNLVRHRLNRVVRILSLLNEQVGLVDTMTPLDFLEFRNLLTPSSGFQSLQFRLVETALGLTIESRHQKEYYKRADAGGFNAEDYQKLLAAEADQSLLQLINRWLERMPFFEKEFWVNYKKPDDYLHPFWSDYRKIYYTGLTEREVGNIHVFDHIFFGKSANELLEKKTSLSATAMRSALFIMLYRDFPVFQTSYQVLDSLIEIDHQMAGWRHKHLVMVGRMIGLRTGTGGTSGSKYLEGALNSHYVFKDIEGLSSFLTERKKLPKLPVELIQKLSYNQSES